MKQSLLEQIAAGNAQAVQRCVDEYGARIWSLARRHLPTAADAEDAVQEAFMDLWKSAHRFDSRRAEESTFVLMIARRRIIDRSRRLPPPEHPAAQEQPWRSSHESVEASAEMQTVARILEGFDSPQREVITMAVCGGYSHAAIAQHLAIPLGTAKTLLRRGLKAVRRALELELAP